MLKQSSSGMKKGLAVLLAALFVVSVTVMAASAREYRHGDHGHYGGHWGHGSYGYVYGAYPYYGVSAGCTVDPITGAIVCPTYGYPYI